jgi:hypothetical protein
VVEAVIQKMTHDEPYWRQGLDENFYSLAPRGESTDSRRTQLKAYGSLIMIAIYHRVPPDPISPFLLARLFQGASALENREFIAAVAPETAKSFCDWPADNSLILPSLKNISLLANLEYQVCCSSSA